MLVSAGMSPLDLSALPPDEEELGKTIDQFPGAQLVGGDSIRVELKEETVNMQIAAYVIPGEAPPIRGIEFESVIHLFYSENDEVPREHGRVKIYDSEPRSPVVGAVTNHQRIMVAEAIKSRRQPDESNVAETIITTLEGEAFHSFIPQERRAWCPLMDGRITVRCRSTKYAVFNAWLGRGKIALASDRLVRFFNVYYVLSGGREHPMAYDFNEKSWVQDARKRPAPGLVDLLPDNELLTEQQLEAAAQAQGIHREGIKRGMTSAEYYTEIRRVEEEARKPGIPALTLHYLGGYTIGLSARYMPDAFTMNAATLERWQRAARDGDHFSWVYQKGYSDGLKADLQPPLTFGYACEDFKKGKDRRRCSKERKKADKERAKRLREAG